MNDLSTIWNPTLRKTSSVPAQGTQDPVDVKQHRKTAHFVHKANTIGIPSEADIANNSLGLNANTARCQSPAKRLNFLGGIKNTLRSKHRSDIPLTEHNKEVLDNSSNKNNDMQRRWSEANPATVILLLLFFPLSVTSLSFH